MYFKELRIGNWVVIDFYKQWELEDYKSYGKKVDGEWQNDNVEPIPLTPEILKKTGFKQSSEFDDTFRLNEFDIYYRISYCEWTVDDRGDNEGTKPRFIKYVHQLQNLYYSLTGTELEINL